MADLEPIPMEMNDRRRFVVIANPVAGRGRGGATGKKLAAQIQKLGAGAEIHFTSSAGDTFRLVRELRSTDAPIPVVCGGDGTIQEGARALAGTGKTLGVAPAGSSNDFVRALGIPDDLGEIARCLCSDEPVALDLGRLADRSFCTVATLGFDSLVSRYVNDTVLPFSGRPAYLWGLLRILMNYQPFKVCLEGDFGSWEGPIFLVAFANTHLYGGGIPIVPSADPVDGRLTACLVRPASRLRVLCQLPRLLKGSHGGLPEVTFLVSRTIQIRTDRYAELWADGECCLSLKPAPAAPWPAGEVSIKTGSR